MLVEITDEANKGNLAAVCDTAKSVAATVAARLP